MPNQTPSYVDTLSSLLNTLFASNGMRISVKDTEGNTVSRQGPDDEFCSYVLGTPETRQQCLSCTNAALKEAAESGKPYIYRCYMGLCSTILPVRLNGKIVAYMVFSGFRLSEEEMAALPIPVPRLDVASTYPELYRHYDDCASFTRAHLEEIIQVLSVTADYLAKVGEQSERLSAIQNRSLELIVNANFREQREKKEIQARMVDMSNRVRTEFEADAMNCISLVAEEEGAHETAELLQDLAVYRRKSGDPTQIVTIGQEVEDLRRYLHLLQAMYGRRIDFRLECGKALNPDHLTVQIPFGTLVDLASLQVSQKRNGDGVVRVRIDEYRNMIHVSVEDNGGARTSLPNLSPVSPELQEKPNDGRIFDVLIEELTATFGKKLRWSAGPNARGMFEVSLDFPAQEVTL